MVTLSRTRYEIVAVGPFGLLVLLLGADICLVTDLCQVQYDIVTLGCMLTDLYQVRNRGRESIRPRWP